MSGHENAPPPDEALKRLLNRRLALVAEAGALNAEHVRLLQRAAGAEIAMLGETDAPDEASLDAELEAVEARLGAVERQIADIDRELDP